MLNYNISVKVVDKNNKPLLELNRYIYKDVNKLTIITYMKLTMSKDFYGWYKYSKRYKKDIVVYKVSEDIQGNIIEEEVYRDRYEKPIDLNKIDDSELNIAQLIYKYAGTLD